MTIMVCVFILFQLVAVVLPSKRRTTLPTRPLCTDTSIKETQLSVRSPIRPIAYEIRTRLDTNTPSGAKIIKTRAKDDTTSSS